MSIEISKGVDANSMSEKAPQTTSTEIALKLSISLTDDTTVIVRTDGLQKWCKFEKN